MTSESTRYHKDMLLTATRPLKSRRDPSRFKRLAVPDDIIPQPIRVTELVLAILMALVAHRYLSTDQLARLHGGSPAYLRHVLRLMLRHGLIERPAGQAAYLSSFLHQGNVSLIYAITRKGMRLLAEHGHPVDPRLDWTVKNTGTGSALFLSHALELSEFMLNCRLSMPDDKSLRLVDHNDLLSEFPAPTRARKFPYQLLVNVQLDGLPHTLTVVPDRLFRLATSNHHWNFALEIDRGNESLMTRSKKITRKATWHKKIAGYFHAHCQAKITETWGFKAMRILTVTTSDERVDHMLAVQRQVTNGKDRGLFLYASRAAIAEHGVLGPAWRSANGNNIVLASS